MIIITVIPMENIYIILEFLRRSLREFKVILYRLEASKVAEIVSVNRNMINRLFDQIRERISQNCEYQSPFACGEIELNESYFGVKRFRGIRKRGAKGKTSVFGMLKRKGKSIPK